jgi:hypothetical protein
MAEYRRSTLPLEYSATELQREFEQIEQVLAEPLQELHAEPLKPRTGMIVLADGTDWNPGGGQGFYGYYAGAWNKLG